MNKELWQKAEDLFHAALERTPAARQSFLEGTCGADTELRQQVELLLAQEQQAGSFLEVPAIENMPVTLTAAESLLGRQFGPYRILSPLGAGGMGEVYRAHDSKLGRDVAIKTLPHEFARDPERLSRLRREARTLASLNHHNIAAIYGLEESEDADCLVMELVDGEALRGPLPVQTTLDYACQVAAALEAAHDKGIIHRDLKPANVRVTPQGRVKVLDFGLAKAIWGPEGNQNLSQLATVTTGVESVAGQIVGTPGYMSPEQARGGDVDKRTDIWAFGCLLYELLAGKRAFPGETLQDTIAAVLEREPDWQALPAKTPAQVRELLRQCLQKDADRRLHNIGDARRTIERAQRGWNRWRVAAIAAAALAMLAIGAALWLRGASARRSALVTSPSEYTQLTNFADSAVAPNFSPDGRMVTFKRGEDAFSSSGQIYVKLLPNGESVRLTNDADYKYAPVFTPDGSRIAYTVISRTSDEWDTWAVPVPGGQPTRVLLNASGLTWITDQRILFSEIKTGLHMGIVTARGSRADRREIYFPANERAMAHYSYASPDHRSVLVVEMDQTHAFHQPCRLVPFDGSSAGRQVGPQGTCTSAAWSPDGKWMYFGATVGLNSHLWRQKFPDGTAEQITFGPSEEEGIALAPDGRSLVTSIGARRSAIWIHDASGERAISSEGYTLAPHLSRDGKRVFYLFARDLVLSSEVGWMASSGELRSVDLSSGKADSVLPGVAVMDYDVSADEKEAAFTIMESGGEKNIWLAALDRRTPPRQVARDGDQVSFGADGDLIFRSLEEKTNGLVRIKKSGSERERITTTPVLEKFAVSPDGEWVIVLSPGVAALAVPIHGGAPKKICVPDCLSGWSSDGRFFYVATRGRKTLVIPVPAGQSLPDLPASGINLAKGGTQLPGARVIEHDLITPGPDPSEYVFIKTELQRNLYRIPLH